MRLLDLLFKDRPKGLSLPEYKSLSNHDGQIKSLPLYEKYHVSLLQRDGEMAIPTVNIGAHVKAGDIIARPTSHLALHRHAPTSGEVSAIVDITETHPSGMTVKALEITADGLDTPTTAFAPISDYMSAERNALIERIFQAGIAGMGGAGFPTEKKINLSEPVETLIINGAECEPYITCDDLLMRHYSEEILRGALIFARIIGAHNILVGIEDNKPEAIAAMQAAAEQLQNASAQPLGVPADVHLAVHILPTQYPMGSRHQIAHYLLGKRPNIKARSYQSGFICHNVATAKAAYDAIALGKPLLERLVTFSGDGVGKAGVYATKCGTDLADIAGDIALAERLDEIIIGGTMMGFAVSPDNDKPLVIKRETTSVLAFSDRLHHTIAHDSDEQNCIRCGQCADACPMDLLPQQLHFYGRGEDFAKLEQHRLFDCIECGLCNYVCPSNIPLVQVFQHSKGDIVADKNAKREAEHARIRFEARNQRLEEEKAEKARKAEARRAKLRAGKQPAASAETASKTATKPAGKSRQQLIEEALARKKAKQAEKAQQRQAQVANEPTETPAEQPAQETPNKPAAKSKQQLIEEALARKKAKQAEKAKQRQAQAADEPAEQPVQEPVAKSKQQLIEEALARKKARQAEKAKQRQAQVAEKPAQEPPNKSAGKSKQQLIEEALARKKARQAEKAKQRQAQTADEPAEQPAQEPPNKSAGKTKQQLIEEALARKKARQAEKAKQRQEQTADEPADN